MYQSVCKDVFNGGRAKAIDSLKEFKFNHELQEFWTSVVNLGSDLSWMLVALAKRDEGETELDQTISESWEAILKEWPQYDRAAETIVGKHHDYFFHEDSILMGGKFFIEKCIENQDNNTVWHSYGFPVFMSMLVLTSLDFHIWMMDDADESFDNIKEQYPVMVVDINRLTAEEYSTLSKYRLGLAQNMEVISSKEITYGAFFKQGTNIKDFRNKLGAFISMDILRRESVSNITGLLRALGGIVGQVDQRKTGGGGSTHMPDDIEDIKFDD